MKNLKADSDNLKLAAIGAVIFFIASLPINNIASALKLSAAYLIFIYLPFIPFANKKNTGIVEKFLLTNLFGLSYAAVYVFLDVIMKIPLAAATYIVATLVIYIVSWKVIKIKQD